LFPTDDSVSHKRDPKRPGRCNYPYFHSKAEGEFGSYRKGVRKRGVCVDIREKITNDHWASGRRAGGGGDGLKYCGPSALPPDRTAAVPRSDIVFFSFFTRCPRKIINSTLLSPSARTLSPSASLSLRPAVFFPSILNGSDNKCYSAVVAPRTNTLNPPIGRRRRRRCSIYRESEPAPSSCAAICNYHNSVRLVFSLYIIYVDIHTHTHTHALYTLYTHTHTKSSGTMVNSKNTTHTLYMHIIIYIYTRITYILYIPSNCSLQVYQ